MKLKHLLTVFFLGISFLGKAQIDENKIGSWYMYFFNADFKESQFGVQGDVQYRNWNLGGDLEQLLLRGAVTYRLVDKSAKIFAWIRAHHFRSFW